MTRSTAPLDDSDRDAWLSGALRHAPDARVDAPPALSDLILRAAQQAAARPSVGGSATTAATTTATATSSAPTADAASAAPAATATRTSVATPAARRDAPATWLVSAWQWIARPPVAAGVASVMVAALVVAVMGPMWSRAVPDAPMSDAPAVVASIPRDAATREAAAAATTPQRIPAAPTAAPIPSPTNPPTNAPTKPPTEPPTNAPAAAPTADARFAAKQAPPVAVADAAPPPRAPAIAAGSAQIPVPAPVPVPVPVPTPAPPLAPAATVANAAAATPPSMAAARSAVPAAAPAAAAAAVAETLAQPDATDSTALRRDRDTMVDGALAGSSGTGAAEVAVPASASIHRPRHADKAAARARSAQAETKPSANAGSANEPLAALRARIAREPERWRWQRAAEPGASHAAQPVADALQRWLAGLDRSSASGWQAASGDADAGAGNAALGDTAGALRLTRDGVLQATMGFNRSGVWLETAGAAGAAAAQFQFRLPSASIDALRSSLHDALREPAR